MRKFFTLVFILLFTLGLTFHDAEAKRFGGGRSFGTFRSVGGYSRSTATPTQFSNASRPTNSWFGPLVGLAAGGLLASLFMGHGLATGLLSWLGIAIAAFLILNLIRNFKQSLQPASYYNNSHLFEKTFNSNSQPSYGQVNTPLNFDTNKFLRDAKAQFLRLQAAYDQKNLRDLQQFTTPQVFAEIQLQLQERGDVPNHTEVVSLDAELLDAVDEDQIVANSITKMIVASVRFTGLIKEEKDQDPIHFNEIWHFNRETNESSWIVAGVQQN